MARVSVKGVARQARAQDRSYAKEIERQRRTSDSFQNFMMGVGIGTDSPLTGNTYGYNPITRNRTRLEWMYRGSWVAGVGIDIIADDMTREGVEITGQLKPEETEGIEELAVELKVWDQLNEAIKWGRLYGGAIAIMLVDGQDFSTPLRWETIGPGQFCGLLVVDRWMVTPSLENLVTTMGPDLGKPKFYTVEALAPALRGAKIHYSRVIRLQGDDLPYWQWVAENMWGMSVLERLYDRLSSFDAATTGAAQLVFRSYLRYLKIEKFRDIVATGGPALKGLQEMIMSMRMFASNEGVVLLDAKDAVETVQNTTMTGIAECLTQLAQQISGGWQIPLVRLLGQSPAGLNSTGESDLKTHYDNIRKKQHSDLKNGVTTIYRCMARSRGIQPPQGFGVRFKPLWQITEDQKSQIAQRDTQTVLSVWSEGKISDRRALEELRNSSHVTNRWNLSDEEIEAASDVVEPPAPETEPPPPPGTAKEDEADGKRSAEQQATDGGVAG